MGSSARGKVWRGRLLAIFSAVVLLLLLAYLADVYLIEIKSTPPSSQGKQNLHGIALALERYAMDHGSYPATFQSIVSEMYIARLPENPYIRKYERRMHWLFPGTPHSPGDFIYLPRESALPGEYHSYDLVLYGREGTNDLSLPEGIAQISEPKYVIYVIRQTELLGEQKGIRYGEDES